MTHTITQNKPLNFAHYPRESWAEHPNFRPATENWLGAHRMFRYLAELVLRETSMFLEGTLSADEFAADLGYYGDALVQNLHGHHRWEDRSYFPELLAAEPICQKRFEALSADHQNLDEMLEQFTLQSNRVIKLLHLDEAQARDAAKALRPICETLRTVLNQHLDDEENLAVPIILHHKLRG